MMMNENGQQQSGERGFNYHGADGYAAANMASMVEQFLEPGETFDDALIRAGMDWADALDFSAIYRKGMTFERPEIIQYAVHALRAHAGDARSARLEALTAATHNPLVLPSNQGKHGGGGGLFGRLRRRSKVSEGIDSDVNSAP